LASKRPPSVTERVRVLRTMQDARTRVDSTLARLEKVLADREREGDDGTKADEFILFVKQLTRATIRADKSRLWATRRLATR